MNSNESPSSDLPPGGKPKQKVLDVLEVVDDQEVDQDPERDYRPEPRKRSARDREARNDRRSVPSASRYECPNCGGSSPPQIRSRTSTFGWVFMWVTIWFCLIGLVGLLFRDEYRMCPECGYKQR